MFWNIMTRWWLMVLVGLSMVAAGCGNDSDPEEASPPLLNVGHVGHDHQLALYVAAERGEEFLAAAGVGLKAVREGEVYDLVEGGQTLARLRLLKVGGGAKMPAALSRGDIDIGFGGVPAVAKLADSQASRNVRIICPLQTDGDMLVMAADSTIDTWPQFVEAARTRDKPLVIGYKAPVAVALLILQRALDAENVTWSTQEAGGAQVILQTMRGGGNAIPLISSHAIDGFVMNQPVPAIAEHKGIGKVIAQLRDLPPAGKWGDHPCCCICATGAAIQNHPAALRALLKCIHLGNAFIAAHPAEAAAIATQWTKAPPEVERASIPTISYGTLPDDSWRAGLSTWLEMMAAMELFQGRLAGKSPHAVVGELCDFSFCNEAAEQLRAAGALSQQP